MNGISACGQMARLPPCVLALCMMTACLPLATSRAADDADWRIIGRQGIVRLVLVPTEQAADRKAYDRQIDRLCRTGETCFLNFYTNTQGVEIVVPLPDEIASQTTATFRRSAKQGAQMFMWSCRLKASSEECF